MNYQSYFFPTFCIFLNNCIQLVIMFCITTIIFIFVFSLLTYIIILKTFKTCLFFIMFINLQNIPFGYFMGISWVFFVVFFFSLLPHPNPRQIPPTQFLILLPSLELSCQNCLLHDLYDHFFFVNLFIFEMLPFMFIIFLHCSSSNSLNCCAEFIINNVSYISFLLFFAESFFLTLWFPGLVIVSKTSTITVLLVVFTSNLFFNKMHFLIY